MYEGKAKRVSMFFDRFADALSKAKSNQAFGYGLHAPEYPDLVVITVNGKEQPENNALSRSKEFFEYRKQPGILMLDHDPNEYGDTFTAQGLIDILTAIDPEIAKAARVIRGSVSAGVHLVGEKPKKGQGFHIYIPVKDASHIPDYGKRLFDHLWLNGYGYIALSSNGGLLIRSPIDAAVFSGERLDFVGKPIILGNGLKYSEPKVKYDPGSYLDMFKLPELSPDEKQKVAALIAKAKKAIEPDSESKKTSYKNNRIAHIMKSTGVSKEEATKLTEKILAGKYDKLWSEWILEFPAGDVSVAEVLENPERYDDKALADPIEGRQYGKTTAKFWWNDGNPIIHSFAHGEYKCYFLSANEPKRYVEGVEPYYGQPSYISSEEACEKMEYEVSQWIKNPEDNFAIAAPAGIGKTRIILKNVAIAATEKFIEIYVPTHQLAEEVKDTLAEFNSTLKVQVIHGRTYADNNDDGSFCMKSNLIKSIQSYGYNINKEVCLDCEFNSRCGYLKQFSDSVQVRIFTHAQLPLRRGLDRKIPDLAIIDERFFTTMIDIKKTTLDYIERYIDNQLLVDVIIDALNNNKPLLAKLRKKFGDNVVTVLENASEQVFPVLPEITSTSGVDELKQKLRPKIKRKQILAVMLKQLKAEIEKLPKRKNSITVRLVNDKVVIANRHELERFKMVSGDETAHVPVLCIDADYCQKVAKVFLPGIRRFKLSVERNAYITQIYTTTNAKSRFFPRMNATKGERESDAAQTHIKDVQSIINNVYSDYGKALIVSYQDLVGNEKNSIQSKLVLPKGCESIHFGGLRGLNKFKHLDVAIIIGRNQLPIDVVESQAAAIWWDSDEELALTGKLNYEQRGFRVQNADQKLGVNVTVCDDYRAQFLQHLQRECETLQAIDRLRLIHNDEVKNVFVLSNVPLDITVDNLVSFKELKTWRTSIEKALMRTSHGVLPLGSEYLVEKFPDLFTNASMVKNKVGAAGLARKIEDIKESKDLLIFNRKEYSLISFRVQGEKGRDRKALTPKRMTNGVVMRHLRKIFKNNIEIIKSTVPRLRLEDIKPIINKFENITERYYRSQRHYDSYYDVWYVVPGEE